MPIVIVRCQLLRLMMQLPLDSMPTRAAKNAIFFLHQYKTREVFLIPKSTLSCEIKLFFHVIYIIDLYFFNSV